MAQRSLNLTRRATILSAELVSGAALLDKAGPERLAFTDSPASAGCRKGYPPADLVTHGVRLLVPDGHTAGMEGRQKLRHHLRVDLVSPHLRLDARLRLGDHHPRHAPVLRRSRFGSWASGILHMPRSRPVPMAHSPSPSAGGVKAPSTASAMEDCSDDCASATKR